MDERKRIDLTTAVGEGFDDARDFAFALRLQRPVRITITDDIGQTFIDAAYSDAGLRSGVAFNQVFGIPPVFVTITDETGNRFNLPPVLATDDVRLPDGVVCMSVAENEVQRYGKGKELLIDGQLLVVCKIESFRDPLNEYRNLYRAWLVRKG